MICRFTSTIGHCVLFWDNLKKKVTAQQGEAPVQRAGDGLTIQCDKLGAGKEVSVTIFLNG